MPSSLHLATSISAAWLIGMVPVFLRPLQKPLEERLQLVEGRLDRLHLALTFSWVPLMPLAGWLLDVWAIEKVLFTGSLILGLSIASLALCQSRSGLLWSVLGVGFGGACVTTAGVAFMPLAFRTFSESKSASVCQGFVFVSLATLSTPRLLSILLGRISFRRTVLSLGLLCLLPAMLVSFLPRPEPVLQVVAESSSFDIRFWLIALVVFLYFPLEFALEMWPRPYLTEIGYTGKSILRLLTGFWIAFLLMRFGLSWIIRPGNEIWLVVVLLILSSMVQGNLAGAYAPSSGSLGFWLVGACYGPILPVLLGILLNLEIPRGDSGLALGLVFALSALSSLLILPGMASFAKKHPPRVLMRVLMLLGLVMAAPMLVLALIR
jgi:hypothetical protein